MLDLDGLREVDVCNAFADAVGSPHPAYTNLTWHVWDSERGRHVRDTNLQIINAPRVVELVGRQAPKENTSMNGSYHITGMHAGRPAYVKVDGSGHCIRYWPREDRWLVDLDGLRDSDICNAYAEVHDSSVRSAEHPGCPNLTWHVWETSRGRHLTDTSVRALLAPHAVRVMGRDPYKENAGINGEYGLVSVLEGRPTYKKQEGDHVIRYWPSEDRWLIDLEAGFHGGDVANAFADARGADSPGNPDLIWYVWETARACHVVDDDVICEPVWSSHSSPSQAMQHGAHSKAVDRSADYVDHLDRHQSYHQEDFDPGPWKSGGG